MPEKVKKRIIYNHDTIFYIFYKILSTFQKYVNVWNFMSSNFLLISFLHALFSFLPFNTKCVSRWIIFKMEKKKKKEMGIYTWKLSEKIVDRDENRRSGMGWYEVGIVNTMVTEECRHTSDKCRVRIADFTRRTLLIFLWTMNTLRLFALFANACQRLVDELFNLINIAFPQFLWFSDTFEIFRLVFMAIIVFMYFKW